MTLVPGHSQAIGGNLSESAPAPESGGPAAIGLGEPTTEDSPQGLTEVMIQARFVLVQGEQDSPHQQLESLIDDLNLLANSPDRQCDLQIAIEAAPGPAPACASVRQSSAAAAAGVNCA